MAEFTFCASSRVTEVIAPEEPRIKDFNGWDYTPNPVLPYRRQFKVMLYGLRWYQNGDGTLDVATNPEYNAGALEAFYTAHRSHVPFDYDHEYLGLLQVRFDQPLNVPVALPDSDGQLEALEVKLLHHNPSY